MANKMLDRSLTDGGLWERATFTVPDSVPDERVQAQSRKYMTRFGKVLEGQGFMVREMLLPQASTRLPEKDRRRYDILAFVSRVPQVIHEDVPDILVPEMQLAGMTLKE